MAVQYEGSAFSRHTKSAAWSIKLLIKHRPSVLFLQYSFLLLVIVSFYKVLAPYKVSIYCDCHTKALRRNLHGWGNAVFFSFKKWSIDATDLVILSNHGQVKDLEKFSARFLIVPDFIPVLEGSNHRGQTSPYCVMSMSFDKDEPVTELADAAELIAKYQHIFITGSAPNWLQQRFSKNPRVHVTGFIEDRKYQTLLKYADSIISLTSEEDCLQCSGYEALAFEVPFVTSDTTALRKYFGGSAIFVNHHPDLIARGVKAVYKQHKFYRRSMAELKSEKMALQQNNMKLLRGLLP